MIPVNLYIVPLDPDGTLYAIRDEKGKTLGSGTRDVCELLIQIINNPSLASPPSTNNPKPVPHLNIRAAIVI